MTVPQANRYIIAALADIYPVSEASAISDLLMEHLTGKSKIIRTSDSDSAMSADQMRQLELYLVRLKQHEPLQYVLNEAWFCGMKLYVDSNVLIPRPETEELVEWIVSDYEATPAGLSVFDIGSGSGSIALALKKKLVSANVWSCDISPGALSVARKNATLLGIDVRFFELDFLDQVQRNAQPSFDILVSNPPYIPEKDRAEMNPNVIRYEPLQALFVPDNNALVFYEALANFGINHLKKNGRIYAEIHESLGDSVVRLFSNYGFSATLKKDMQGKERMVRVVSSRESVVVSQ